MDKKTEHFLRKIIIESHNEDMGEMAYVSGKERDVYGNPETKPFKFRPAIYSGSEVYGKKGEEVIPDGWLINPDLKKGGERLIIRYYDCGEFETFVNQIRHILDDLEDQYGLEPELIPCKAEKGMTEPSIARTKYQPRTKDLGTSYKSSGIGYTGEEKIRRKLYSILRRTLGKGSSILNEFKKRSIPPIIIDRSYLDTHTSEANSDKISTSSMSYNSYESLGDFFDSAISVLEGGEPSGMKTHHLARGYNQIYNNWPRGTKSYKIYKGKTKVYKLDRFGFEFQNLDVSTLSKFSIVGTRHDDGYMWVINLNVLISKKKNDDKYLSQDYIPMNNVRSSVVVPIDSSIEYDDKFTPLDDETIVNGLMECIEDFKSKILSIDPEEVLNFATLDVFQFNDAVSSNEEINENKKINLIVKSVLSEIKK